MEHSSPLAAMQPPSVLFGHCFHRPSDVPNSCGSFGSMSAGLGANSNSNFNFNFKDLSMRKSQSDYLSVKHVNGSSPSASLAADLSQNFHIDQSPQFATPRRSLFSGGNLFGSGNGRENAIATPPIPSSSPAPPSDAMDMSPLPHKPPFIANTDIKSPPSDHPSVDSPMSINSPSGIPPGHLQDSPSETSKDGPHERRRPNFLRASLARSKTQSLQLGISRPFPESQAPPLKFGNGTAKTSTPSLEDMFGDSPPRERPTTLRYHSSGVANSRFKPCWGHSGSSHARGNGSPGIRKSSPQMRPRKQCRRSVSMFEHPDDVLLENEAKFTGSPNAPLQSISDITEASPSLQLPHFTPEDQADSLPRIDKSILLELMDGKYSDRFENVMVIDCRFEYEYDGGHINGAINHNDKEHLAAELFSPPKPRTALILHCEYSAHRAPIMARHIRHSDRSFNADQYPTLTYPDLYILEGGYSAFFAQHRALCFPQNYVEMNSKEHEVDCERGLGKVKQRSKLDRAHTFAFGEQSPRMQDSPTGRCRTGRLLDSPFREDSHSSRAPTRRMLSY